jgi:hypothetical protein
MDVISKAARLSFLPAVPDDKIPWIAKKDYF